MRHMRLLPSIVIAVTVAVTIVVVQLTTAPKEYVQSIERKRAEIDAFMRNGADSPITADDLANFSGLNYYPVDVAYRTRGKLERFADPETIEVLTSAGTFDPYTRYGLISFRVAGTGLTLEAWKPINIVVSNRLFVVFADLTSGDETYGGGRYLDLFLDSDDTVMVDFNLAYNPYCVYNPEFVCPVTPLENRLSVAIRSGEKNWQ